MLRGDLVAALQGREAERLLAEQAGWQDAADAAESNVLYILNQLGRAEEALVRGRALLARVDALGGATEGNLPWVFNALIASCIALGRLDEAAALVPRAHAMRLRFEAEVLPLQLVSLAAARQQHAAAARLIGHARASYEVHAVVLEPMEQALLDRIERQVTEALGPARATELMHQGRVLDEAAAAALAAEPGPEGAGLGHA